VRVGYSCYPSEILYLQLGKGAKGRGTGHYAESKRSLAVPMALIWMIPKFPTIGGQGVMS
jgi:hypothetical protein